MNAARMKKKSKRESKVMGLTTKGHLIKKKKKAKKVEAC